MAPRYGCAGDHEEANDQGENRPILAWPFDADAFAGPETAECAEQHADGKFEHVLGDEDKRSMQCEPEEYDDRQSCSGADTGGKQLPACRSDRDNDEDD